MDVGLGNSVARYDDSYGPLRHFAPPPLPSPPPVPPRKNKTQTKTKQNKTKTTTKNQQHTNVKAKVKTTTKAIKGPLNTKKYLLKQTLIHQREKGNA